MIAYHTHRPMHRSAMTIFHVATCHLVCLHHVAAGSRAACARHGSAAWVDHSGHTGFGQRRRSHEGGAEQRRNEFACHVFGLLLPAWRICAAGRVSLIKLKIS
jgi:hypothetical protein